MKKILIMTSVMVAGFASAAIFTENFTTEPPKVISDVDGALTFNEEVATSTINSNVWTYRDDPRGSVSGGYAQLGFNGAGGGRVMATSLDESLFGGVAGTYTVNYDFIAEKVPDDESALGLKIFSATADSLYDISDFIVDLDPSYGTATNALVGTGAYSLLAAQTPLQDVGNNQSLDFVYDGSSEIVLMFYSINPSDQGSAGANGYVQFDNVSVVIPEPATLGLVVAFGGGIVFLRRIFAI